MDLTEVVMGMITSTTGIAVTKGIITDGASNMRVLREGVCQICNEHNAVLADSPAVELAEARSFVCLAHCQDLGARAFWAELPSLRSIRASGKFTGDMQVLGDIWRANTQFYQWARNVKHLRR